MATRATKRQDAAGTAGPGGRRAAGRSGADAGDRYLELVRSCPLRLIRNEADYEQAIDMLNQLSDRGQDRTHDETEYLLALSVFVEKYEDEHDPIAPASGTEMLRALIESRQITPNDVAAGAGLAASTVSDLLAGKEEMSVDQIERLARFLEVKPSFFLGNEFGTTAPGRMTCTRRSCT